MTKLFDIGKYRVVENPYQEDAGIELLGGDWHGLVFQFGKVQFEDGKPNINIQRTIRRLTEGMDKTETNLEELLNNNELNELMGEILIEVMQEQIRRDKEDEQRTT